MQLTTSFKMACLATSITLLFTGTALAQNAPEENRFTKIKLADQMDEPTELAVSNNGDVFFVERKGKVKYYNAKRNESKTINDFDVHTKHEYGIMGIGLDPKFEQNNWIYLYYSSKKDSANLLSRFVFDTKNEQLDLSSEKKMLKVGVKWNDCCHTGGSIDWDKAGNLYLSTGDDTNPFASDGYGPMDNRPGREGWDARASSSNTNDLRGKILRIKPSDDGGYTIPDGNLFPSNIPDKNTRYDADHSPALVKGGTRPEIYVMGCRNPYRIHVDRRTGYVYWGDVGPDAAEATAQFGPRGHDEVNQARKAGYFGWPLFVADNRAYRHRDFNDNSTSYTFDPLKPINDSPHNTGLVELPPAQKAFIYYPYVDSPEFGETVGKGSRNAMAGPVYYYNDYPESAVKFPKYYDKKFFSYDWTRDRINPVTMNEAGDFVSMERFLPSQNFMHPIDMAFGPEGALYLLEYGPNWFAQNEEAMLSRIEYNPGNRAPKVLATADKKVGALPLKVQFSGEGSTDPDGDSFSYKWEFGNGKSALTSKASTVYTKVGVYKAVLTCTDKLGKKDSQTIEIEVGNERPQVVLKVKGNKTFYWDNDKIDYEVQVMDKEDGSTLNKKIKAQDVYVNIAYLEGYDKTIIAQGHQANTSFSTGKRLIELSDCKACHSVDKKSIGPSYKDIAAKYKPGNTNISKLSDKIIKGGGGVWGEQAMAAHPQLSVEDSREMVKYILSLNDPKKKGLATKGIYPIHGNSKSGNYIVSASYTDKGSASMPPQTGNNNLVLRSAKMKSIYADEVLYAIKYKTDDYGDVIIPNTDKGYALFKNIDLTGVKSIKVDAISKNGGVGGTLALRIGSPNAAAIATKLVGPDVRETVSFGTMGMAGHKDVYLTFENDKANGKSLFMLGEVAFEKK